MSNLNHSSIFEEDIIETVVVEKDSTPKVMLTYEDFCFDDLQLYGGLDCIATSEILAKLLPVLVEIEDIHIQNIDGTRETVRAPAIIESIENIEMKAHEFIIDLEINGIGYSKSRNESMGLKMLAEVEVLNDKIFTKLGRKVNLDSGVEVAELLYSTLGFEVPFTTKGGEPATDGVALMTLARLDPLGGKYLAQDPNLQYLADMAKRRDIHSVYNTFIKTYYSDWVKSDGRIHPSYNLHGTSSFRITGSDPNLTQLPRAKHGYNVRACFVVPDGRVFISFDFSSAEVKVLANLAKEPAMLKAIEDGLDFHSFSASSMQGIPYDEFVATLADKSNPLSKRYKELRQIAKTL